VNEERVFEPPRGPLRHPRRRHLTLTVAADLPAGRHVLELPNAERVIVQESDAAETWAAGAE
jgi:hypothetical protein